MTMSFLLSSLSSIQEMWLPQQLSCRMHHRVLDLHEAIISASVTVLPFSLVASAPAASVVKSSALV
jgi:hypothetical protein